MVAGTVLVGIALGAVFGLVYDCVRMQDMWTTSLALGAIAFSAGWVVPFLKHPANPPGIGDPDTIGPRTRRTSRFIVVSLVAAALAWRASQILGQMLLGRAVTSPAVAAQQTAGAMGLDADVDDRLSERDFGRWPGRSLKERLDDLLTWPAARLTAWRAVALAPVVGGHRSESWRALRREGVRRAVLLSQAVGADGVALRLVAAWALRR